MSGDFAGGLAERVTLFRRDPARDVLGGASGDWTAVREAWAAIVPVGLKEMPRWRVMLRSEGEAPRIGDRIGWRGRILRVTAVGIDPAFSERLLADTEEER